MLTHMLLLVVGHMNCDVTVNMDRLPFTNWYARMSLDVLVLSVVDVIVHVLDLQLDRSRGRGKKAKLPPLPRASFSITMDIRGEPGRNTSAGRIVTQLIRIHTGESQ